MEEDMRNLCKAVGMSINMISKNYGIDQDKVLELFMQMMKQIQDKIKG